MKRWLFKSDPETYSWKNLAKDKKTVWDGVRNNLALKHLREIQKGDPIFIYHSGDLKSIVGIAEAASNSYPDPKNKDTKLAVVDIAPLQTLKKQVPLSEIKANPKLQSWELVRMSRLSVMPTTDEQWAEVLRLSQ